VISRFHLSPKIHWEWFLGFNHYLKQYAASGFTRYLKKYTGSDF